MVSIPWDRSTEDELAKYKTLHSWWKEKTAKPISKIDHREHNQEADHWANIGAQRQRKIVLDRCDNSETWKAVKGHWAVPLLFFSVYGGQFHSVKGESDELVHISKRTFYFPFSRQSGAILSHKFP